MNYPNGRKKQGQSFHQPKQKEGFGKRGMTLEDDINVTNTYYISTNKAVVHKKPTPVQIVKVHYPKRSAAVITEGYFKQASTTDYNGIYRGRYIDFEAKETKSTTRFPLANIHEHQAEHMKAIIAHGGIAFMIIRFTMLDLTYLLDAEKLLSYWYGQNKGGRKSIPLTYIEQEGFHIPFHYQARVDYLKIVDRLYFRSEE
ncbi:Holliday junction resolvase RecU [Lentibacillus saliphilus]|uniref:Holliday junction resolvase RecU n=1 Tax=Lentibacillus saliphilus TaxID=2737028 RepID=UPI001C2FF5E7|nr:Holliday junction resolvase RecU [Lentibacillus saliphilus]